MKNHLGIHDPLHCLGHDVLVTVSDLKVGVAVPGVADSVGYYRAKVLSMGDYYPFGSAMPGRMYVSSGYWYGFNGKLSQRTKSRVRMDRGEKDDEWSGEGNSLDFGARVFDSRLGRWFALDPLQKKLPGLSPYHSNFNNPTRFFDSDGKYGTDGHYWTVMLVAKMLKIPYYRAIATAAEAPDNEMHGDLATYATATYLNGKDAHEIHALTGGDSGEELEISIAMILGAKTLEELGNAIHRFADSFAHRRLDDESKMYEFNNMVECGNLGINCGHKNEPQADFISTRPQLYIESVIGLSKTLGEFGEKHGIEVSGVDMFVFNYIAENAQPGYNSNSAILQTELKIQEGKTDFVIQYGSGEEIQAFLNARNEYYGTNYSFRVSTAHSAVTIGNTTLDEDLPDYFDVEITNIPQLRIQISDPEK